MKNISPSLLSASMLALLSAGAYGQSPDQGNIQDLLKKVAEIQEVAKNAPVGEQSPNDKKTPEQKKKEEFKKAVFKQAYQLVNQTEDTAKGEVIADTVVFLEPVLNEMDNSEKAGQKLASLIKVDYAKIGPLDSWDKLTSFQKEISDAVAFKKLKTFAMHFDYAAMERAIKFLGEKYPDKYTKSAEHLKTLADFRTAMPDVKAWLEKAEYKDLDTIKKMADFRMNALVRENPEVNFEDYVAVRRYSTEGKRSNYNHDRPTNWQGISSMPGEGRKYQSEIITKTLKAPDASGKKILNNDRWIGHLDVDFDGQKMLYTTNSFGKENKRPWDIFELDFTTGKTQPLSQNMPTDTDSSDSCYLPDGRILFINTSGMQGVPCVGGNDYVGNLHLLDRKSGSVRRLTLDQDNNWFPTLLHDGRVMFLRWEYTESAHYFSRVLMHMNPDGSDQKEYYGSNSYWPNSLFNAKAIPGKPGMFVGIVSGHHGIKRVGEMTIFDVNRGRTETEGAVQKVPGFGQKVENITKDELVNGIKTPYFAEPYPLSENFFLASCCLSRGDGHMNIVFCDKFDNIIPLTASDSFVYAEPRPVQGRKKPPVIPDRVNLESSVATAYITDVNEGRAMKGVPRGKAKSLRVFMSEYSPRNTGSHYAMGMESNWDVKVLYGTTPVQKDGSARFEIPANQPITVQVLDEEGRALALMRSWFTAMPGEVLSCIGCHENQNEAPPARMAVAFRQKPEKLTPWHGPARTFTFLNEVQGVLDKNCITCHDGSKTELPNFASTELVKGAPAPGGVSYWALHPFVRRNGPEGNYKGLDACEFHVDTSELVQLLKKGHHGVKLNKEEWDRLYTWIDMNAPYRGDWPGERNEKLMARRYDLHQQYTTIKRDYVTMVDSMYQRKTDPAATAHNAVPLEKKTENAADKAKVAGKKAPVAKGFPFAVTAEPKQETINLGNNVTMKFRQIPAGEFIMGSADETPSEQPVSAVKIKKPYLMGETEVTLEQYRQFDPEYENGWYDMHYKDQVRPGYNMDADNKFPVIRVPWTKAMEFCKWLSQKTGKKVTLPTEAQWEFAARAGSDKAFSFGDVTADFSSQANLADVKIKELAVTGVDPHPIPNPNRFYDFVPRDETFNDEVLHLAPVAKYKANPFGLYDMIGNVAEWTRSEYRPYPWSDKDGRNGNLDNVDANRTVRGGSWRDRPKRATSSWRWGYPAWRKVYNVGFRVVIED